MPEAPFDEAQAHKWLGIEFNNQAWGLWEKPSRTGDENERMVQMAYAACLHWSYVGGPEKSAARIGVTHMHLDRSGPHRIGSGCGAEMCGGN